jgi:hypothetical protein
LGQPAVNLTQPLADPSVQQKAKEVLEENKEGENGEYSEGEGEAEQIQEETPEAHRSAPGEKGTSG